MSYPRLPLFSVSVAKFVCEILPILDIKSLILYFYLTEGNIIKNNLVKVGRWVNFLRIFEI